MQMTCPKCGNQGTLTLRLTISKGIRYHYYYVQHVSFNEKRKTKWCYLGKHEDLSNEIKELMKNEAYTQMYTQTDTQTPQELDELNLRTLRENTQENSLSPFHNGCANYLFTLKSLVNVIRRYSVHNQG